jgi:hypothetical protein
MKIVLIACAFLIGFCAPISVALVSGVKLGTDAAGICLVLSWLFGLFLSAMAREFSDDLLK